MEDGKIKAQIKQGKDILEFLIHTKPSYFKDSLTFSDHIQNKWHGLFNKSPKWIKISIKEGNKTKTAYLLQALFEKQDFKQIVKKVIKQKIKQEVKKQEQIAKVQEKKQKPIVIEEKTPIKKEAMTTAPMLYSLDKVKIDKTSSFEDLRHIATKYLKLDKTSHDSHILSHITRRLEELKKDPFGKNEREVLHTLNVKYLNAEIPKIGICLKQIQEASSIEQKQELMKKALKLPQDASIKMIQAAFNRLTKELSASKEAMHLLSLHHLKELFEAAPMQTQTA